MFIVIAVFGILAALIYVNILRPYGHWKKKGVPHLKPFLIFGNLAANVFRRKTLADILQDMYNDFPEERYFGIFQFFKPVLVLKDLDLIKQIAIKDFDYFPDHRTMVAEDVDPLWAKNLFATKGNKWKDLRSTLSPTFTSSKMKYMFTLMTECSEQMIEHFSKKASEKNASGKSGSDIVEVELKDVFTRYTNDVIATTAFGVKCDSLKDPKNEFYLMGKDLSNFGGLRGLIFFLYSFSPRLMKILDAKFIPDKVSKFFRSVIKETITLRTEKGLIRPDMIHLMLEARKGKTSVEESTDSETGFATAEEYNLGKVQSSKYLTDEEITAQALIFFLGGFDTASVLMCCIGYELAVNPDVQDKLRREIDETYEECDGKITYDALMKMTYFDMVVTETLRKFPAILTDRESIKPYTISAKLPHEKRLDLDPGTLIWIPMYAIHRDPKYYPDPEKFDPERFSEENKSKIDPYAYVPFGVGPRNCIGSRFAILENKTIFFHILRNFEIVPVKKTPIPLRMDPKYFNYTPYGGYRMGFKKRNL